MLKTIREPRSFSKNNARLGKRKQNDPLLTHVIRLQNVEDSK